MDRRHLKCLLWKGLWLISLVSLVVAWYGVGGNKVVLGLNSLGWFWNAVIFGILAVPVKLDCRACGVCKIGAVQSEG